MNLSTLFEFCSAQSENMEFLMLALETENDAFSQLSKRSGFNCRRQATQKIIKRKLWTTFWVLLRKTM